MPNRTNELEILPMPATIKTAWIPALDRQLGWDDLPRSWRLLNAVLHALCSSDADMPLEAARQTIRRCGTLAEDLPPGPARFTIAKLMQRVATGFMPDRLENPEDAVLAVLDVLEGEIEQPGLDEIRRELRQVLTVPRRAIPVRWKPAWLSAA